MVGDEKKTGGVLIESEIKKIENIMQNLEIIKFENIGHNIHDEIPEEFENRVISFLNNG